ncbi:hypothetical protein 8G_00003 [Ralstonia phage Hyacinthe]|uniref:Uncharacterized protein n=3 Tax=Rahariannevirus raharianne TaxID=2846050 RepID=A0A7G5BBB8_9CAUD|nr:hypothetical protein KMC43_gp22 [Ralstonia phage Raharianne]QMV32397.1 hypothetical protein U2_00022 [Ralstonia phage Albius]QMV33435.1 hypothetical protein 8G_00003 [Ralstonia phage Hyacinthe]QMV33591.1 hypothetical protein Y2_00022 [Ralstonia phage Raharianne]
MIKNSKQDWSTGSIVRIGFMSLTVVAAIPTPGDSRPDSYVLASKTAFYRFTPHHGVEKISADEARELVESAKREAAKMAASAVDNARKQSAHSAVLAQLMN